VHIHGNQIKTLDLQISYDTKLDNATYDALKAFQLNTVNSGSSDLANSKLRDIEASANTFFNSIANNFNMVGYNQEILSEYVPALVYTMYDGYYIYSAYTNRLTSDEASLDDVNSEATYRNNQRLSGLKPYIFYSCRYKNHPNTGDDFVITYSLDNYITIQGTVNGKKVFDYGYLLNNIDITTGEIKYRGVKIDENETLSEYIWDPDLSNIKKYSYVKVNGVKYYYEGTKCFTILNGQKLEMRQGINGSPSTTAAKEYYKKAYDFTQKVLNSNYIDSENHSKNDGYNLRGLKGSHAVDEKGDVLYELDETGQPMNTFKLGDYLIFDGNTSLEDTDSNFNQQRLSVIRYSIEKNLSIAITNYNPTGTIEFKMPELKEDEWDKIVNNVSIVSFLQGLNIGGKVYNGYSIITNNKNEEVVSEDSIYILEGNQYHKANDNQHLTSNNLEGVLNIDLERKSVNTPIGMRYIIPKRRNRS